MLYAISEMQRLIKKATGVELSSSEGITDRAHAIEFRFAKDESLGNDGYRYFFEGSRLVIEGAVARGSSSRRSSVGAPLPTGTAISPRQSLST